MSYFINFIKKFIYLSIVFSKRYDQVVQRDYCTANQTKLIVLQVPQR